MHTVIKPGVKLNFGICAIPYSAYRVMVTISHQQCSRYLLHILTLFEAHLCFTIFMWALKFLFTHHISEIYEYDGKQHENKYITLI